MNIIFTVVIFFSCSAFAQIDTSIYKNVGNYNQPVQPYQMQVQPVAPVQVPQIKQTDYTCLNRCTQSGLMYGFCQSKCSY